MAWQGGAVGSMWCDGGVRALMPAETWAALVAQGSRRTYERDQVLVSEGSAGTQVLVLVEGRVKITRDEADGTEVLLAIRGAGEIIGEMSALDGGMASATVTALRPCTAHRLSAREFRDFVRTHALAEPMLQHASARRRESDQIRIELSTLSVTQRLVRTLIRLMDAIGVQTADGISVDIGVPQEDLGRAIGASRSQVAAELAHLRTLRILDTGRRRVLVRDPDELRTIDKGRNVRSRTVRAPTGK